MKISRRRARGVGWDLDKEGALEKILEGKVNNKNVDQAWTDGNHNNHFSARRTLPSGFLPAEKTEERED